MSIHVTSSCSERKFLDTSPAAHKKVSEGEGFLPNAYWSFCLNNKNHTFTVSCQKFLSVLNSAQLSFWNIWCEAMLTKKHSHLIYRQVNLQNTLNTTLCTTKPQYFTQNRELIVFITEEAPHKQLMFTAVKFTKWEVKWSKKSQNNVTEEVVQSEWLFY